LSDPIKVKLAVYKKLASPQDDDAGESTRADV